MVAALTSREIERPVSRKRAQRVMRAERLLQRHRPSGRRRRPGHFRVERPDQLWHMDMTAIWVAEHGWCYLNAIVDCCTREIAGLVLDLRCRRQEAEAVIEAWRWGPRDRARPSSPSARITAPPIHRAASEPASRGSASPHRRGGYRDPESQAFIESWFSKLKERLIWRSEFETLEDARAAIAAYVETYHHRPHSGLDYRTPKEVRKTWEDAQESEATTNSRGLR